MPYRIAGIDVHKKMLAVVAADVEIDGDFHFERQKVGTTPADLRGRKKDFPDAERLVKRLVRAGAHLELRAGRRAAALAQRDAPQVPSHP